VGDLSYIGRRHGRGRITRRAGALRHSDVIYLLRSANAFFPHARLSPGRYRHWPACRPLLDRPAGGPSAASREHRWSRARAAVAIAGGKLTTYRVMAATRWTESRPACATGWPSPRPARRRTGCPSPGGETADLEGLVKAAMERGRRSGRPATSWRPTAANQPSSQPGGPRPRAGANPSSPGGRPCGRGSARVEREMAVRLSDVLCGALHLFYATATKRCGGDPVRRLAGRGPRLGRDPPCEEWPRIRTWWARPAPSPRRQLAPAPRSDEVLQISRLMTVRSEGSGRG